MCAFSGFRIADISHAADEDSDSNIGYKFVQLTSSKQLITILNSYSGNIGHTFTLEASDGQQLGICVSDQFGALIYRHYGQQIKRRVRPRDVIAPDYCLFWSEGIVSEIAPEDLLPVEEVIRLAVFFYENAALPATINIRSG